MKPTLSFLEAPKIFRGRMRGAVEAEVRRVRRFMIYINRKKTKNPEGIN
jgi:hypothetical protein